MEPAGDSGVVERVHRPAGPGAPLPALAATGLLLVMSSLPLSFRVLYMLEAGARFRLEDLAARTDAPARRHARVTHRLLARGARSEPA